MKNTFLTSCVISLLLGSAAANATLIQSSTTTFLTFRDCESSGATACDSITGTVIGTFDGDPGDLTAAASQTDAAYGTSSGSAALSGVAGAPILSGHVTSLGGTVADPGTRNGANSAALQRYTYTGAAPTTRTFGGTLGYNQSIPAGNAGFPFSGASSGVRVYLEIFTLADAFLDVGITAQDNFFSLFNNYVFAPGYTSLASDTFEDSLSNTAVVGLPSLTVNLNPGDSIWALTRLQAIATNGAEVNANSLVTGWDDIDGLAPANSVPAPATLALLGLGLAGLILHRRRKV